MMKIFSQMSITCMFLVECSQIDALIAETNLLERKIISKVHLGSFSLGWKPNSREELLAFLGLTICVELIIKESMKAFWRDWVQEAHQLLEHFSLKTGY